MGYRCPVCEGPQADDTHLANHLAFTAILRGGDHEGWLDEHVPGWGEMGETDLAPRVAEFAESVEHPVAPEGNTDHAGDDEHEQGDRRQSGVDRPEMSETPFGAGIDENAREVIEQAREMTRQRRTNARENEPETDSQDPGDEGDSGSEHEGEQ